MSTSPPSLETARLHLRPFVIDDFANYAQMTGDPHVMRYIGGTALDRTEARRSLEFVLRHWTLHGFGLWAVDEKASGALIGRIGLFRPEHCPGIEVGWLIVRDRWDEGFATEGGRAAVRFGFETLGADRLISIIDPSNSASIRVAEKLGARREGPIRITHQDADLYAIARAEWHEQEHRQSDSPVSPK